MQTKTEINKYITNTSQLPLTLTVTDLAKVLGIGKANVMIYVILKIFLSKDW